MRRELGEQDPIERYLAELAGWLTMSPEERDATLEEFRAHLWEQADVARADGATEAEAQRLAVERFGDAKSLGQRLSRMTGTLWGWRRSLGGVAVGAALTWAIWIAWTLPALIAYYQLQPTNAISPDGTPVPTPNPFILAFGYLSQSSPLDDGAFYAFLHFGFAWLLPPLLLYAVAPFWWGGRAERWWAPGLAYGLGTWLAVPWFAFFFFRFDNIWGVEAESRVVLLALPLALLAGGAGYLWRKPARQRPALTQAPA